MQTFDRKTLKRVRQEADLTQEQMGELIGVGRLSIIRWEAGEFKPNHFVIDKVLQVVNQLEEELARGHRRGTIYHG